MLIRFLHFLGMAMWLGGALAAMTIAFGARSEPAAVRAGVYRVLARVHSLLIGAGALVTVASGLAMTMTLVSQGQGSMMGQPGIIVMQGAGLIAGLLVVLIGVPTAVKISGLSVVDDRGEIPPVVERLRKRQAIVSSVAGALALVALVGGTLLR